MSHLAVLAGRAPSRTLEMLAVLLVWQDFTAQAAVWAIRQCCRTLALGVVSAQRVLLALLACVLPVITVLSLPRKKYLAQREPIKVLLAALESAPLTAHHATRVFTVQPEHWQL